MWSGWTREELIEQDSYERFLSNDRKLQKLEQELCKRDLWHWLTHWVWTQDQKDEADSIKRLPRKAYFREIVDSWLAEPLLLIPKSRQMMVTWLLVAINLWLAQFHTDRNVFLQSKKEKDAFDLLGRMKFIWENQPFFMRPFCKWTEGEAKFSYLRSMVRAIPQGGDQIRMQTASSILMDEVGFMEEAEEAYTAAKPSIDGGGRITMVSTANPGFFCDLVNEGRLL